MKEQMMKRAAAGLSAALLAAALGLAGCAGSAEENATDAPNLNLPTESRIAQISIPLKVTSPGADNQVSYDDTITIGEGSTALDVLQATGLELDAQQAEYGMFVNAVDGLANEGMKGWTYTVNGEQVQTPADQMYLKDGDQVTWSYIDMSA